MNESNQATRVLPREVTFQKGLMIANGFCCLFLIIAVLTAGAAWFSDRAMGVVLNKAVIPRLNRLIQNRPEQMAVMLSSLDHRTLGRLVNEAVARDPLILSEFLGGFQSETLSVAVNKALEERADFLSDFVGTLDSASLEDIIDQIAEDHTEFMTDLVDQIIELIRKDFMKSGI